MTTENISIAIAEDNTLALKSILAKLAGFNELSIGFTALNGMAFLQYYSEQQTAIVLMDIEMPLMDGIAATTILKQRYPAAKVLMLTTFDDDDKIFNAILAGASGYLLKDEDPEMIRKSIVDVYNGGAAMSAGIALKTLNYIKSTVPSAPSQSILTQRETEILIELKSGLSYQKVADKLFISEGTIRKHVENIYRKLQVNNKISAVNVATANRWL